MRRCLRRSSRTGQRRRGGCIGRRAHAGAVLTIVGSSLPRGHALMCLQSPVAEHCGELAFCRRFEGAGSRVGAMTEPDRADQPDRVWSVWSGWTSSIRAATVAAWCGSFHSVSEVMALFGPPRLSSRTRCRAPRPRRPPQHLPPPPARDMPWRSDCSAVQGRIDYLNIPQRHRQRGSAPRRRVP